MEENKKESIKSEEKSADEIVEETMKEIFDDLSREEEKETKKETKEEVKEEKEPEEEPVREDEEEHMENEEEKKEKNKKWMKIAGGIIGGICLVYLGVSLFFINHFYYGTQINGANFSGKKAEDLENYIKQQVSAYTLTLSEKDGKTELIKGSDIDLRYRDGKRVEQALKDQNPLLWITAFFGNKDTSVVVDVDYNKEKLDQLITGLECVKEENQIAPVMAQPVFDGEQFVVQPEVYGTLLNQEVFFKKMHESVEKFQAVLDFEAEGCYVLPKYKKDAKEVHDAAAAMNEYIKGSVTYSVEPVAVVDKALISQWVKVDDNMQVIFDTDAVGAYVDELCNQYNTVGKVRTITTPTGKKAEVSGGNYGWKINRDAEYEALMNNIKGQEIVTREPVFEQKAVAYGPADWGSTYVEVDLSNQHMWYVVNGAVAMETDVVTGVPVPARRTPPGVFTILERKRNKTLRGDRRPDGSYEYETPVAYWMRVTWTGIGFHDATWQRAFGGELYKTGRGSHGCINMPIDKAAQLYGMLETGTPVVMHY